MLLLALGAVLIILGFLMLIWPRGEQDTRGISEKSDDTDQPRVKGGAVVMIGPIPIVIGSDPKIALFMMIIAMTMMILWALTIKGN